MAPLDLIDAWPARHAAAGLTDATGTREVHGALEHRFAWGSVTKLLAAWATLVAAEEGALDLDEPAGPQGSTVRHLLAHASGLAWDSPKPLGGPGERRVYSNTGYVVLAEHLAARAAMPFADYLAEAVLRPLGLAATLEGDAAGGIVGTVGDLLAFGREALAPTLVAPETLAEATSVQFPGLDGVLPDFGRFRPLDWGLGVELKGAKEGHWSGARTSPQTFGHFGGSGTFLWVDPVPGVACAVLTTREFGEWAKEAWPRLSDAVIGELA